MIEGIRKLSSVSKKSLPVELLLAGDICLGEHFFNCGDGVFSRTLDGEEIDPISGVREVVDDADLFIFNLESPVSIQDLDENDIYSRCFRGHPATLKFLKLAENNLFSIANNHIMQHGSDVAQNTIKHLALNNLDYVGLKNTENSFLCQPYSRLINGKKITFLSWSWVEEQHVKEFDIIYANSFNDKSLKQISETSDNSDFLVVSIHAGIECRFEQNQLTERLRSIAEAGADLVAVHHSHFFHRIEYWYGSVIFYGLGNFVFDLLWHERLISSYLVRVKIGDGVENLRLIPVRLGEMGLPSVAGEIKSIDLKKVKHGQIIFPDQEAEIRHRIPIGISKFYYFISNIFRGKKKLKASFLIHKLQTKITGRRFS